MAATTPESFIKHTPARPMGTECEYDLQGCSIKEISDAAGEDKHQLLGTVAEELGLDFFGEHLSNGARVYSDVAHLEYATPECLGPKKAVAAEFAGVKIVNMVTESFAKRFQRKVSLYRHSGVYVTKPGTIQKTKTQGYHENYQVPHQTTDDPLFRHVFASFLASRTWAMSGGIGHKGFMLSQKSPAIRKDRVFDDKLMDRTVEHKKPAYVITPAGDAFTGEDARLWRRLEIRLADPGHSPDIQFLAKASTSLALRLFEHLPEFRDKLRELELKRPGEAIHTFGSDVSLEETAATSNGAALTALDIQEAFLELVILLAEKHQLPEDERFAIGLWAEVLDDMRASRTKDVYYPERMLRRVDFAARHYYLAKKVGQDALTMKNPEAVWRDVTWDRIFKAGGGTVFFAAHPPEYVDIEDIESFIRTPPQDTRAKVRADSLTQIPKRSAIGWSGYRTSTGSTFNSFGPVVL